MDDAILYPIKAPILTTILVCSHLYVCFSGTPSVTLNILTYDNFFFKKKSSYKPHHTLVCKYKTSQVNGSMLLLSRIHSSSTLAKVRLRSHPTMKSPICSHYLCNIYLLSEIEIWEGPAIASSSLRITSLSSLFPFLSSPPSILSSREREQKAQGRKAKAGS